MEGSRLPDGKVFGTIGLLEPDDNGVPLGSEDPGREPWACFRRQVLQL